MTPIGPLVIGYGNPLRADDGFGWHAAAYLTADSRFSDVEVVGCHQLTPELTVRIASASVVVFIDARITGAAPGSIEVRSVGSSGESPTSLSHHCEPWILGQLATQLFAREPPAFVVEVEAHDVSVSERMTPVMERALPGVADEVARLITEQT